MEIDKIERASARENERYKQIMFIEKFRLRSF